MSLSKAKALIQSGDYLRAIECLNKLTENSDVLFHLGLAHQLANDADASMRYYRKTLSLDATHCKALTNLGLLLFLENRSSEGISLLQWAYQHYPKNREVIQNLTFALSHSRRAEEAGVIFEQSIADRIIPPELFSSYLFNTHNVEKYTPREIFELHKKWGTTFGGSCDKKSDKKIDPNKKIRIGYVSPNLKLHSVAYFLLPVIHLHDKTRFEIHCFSNTKVQDSMTEILRAGADHWHDITQADDSEAAEMIASHNVDILIDLAGHSQGNRLGIFLLKPAPIQITYLGYPDTSGLSQMDYRITDALADPSPVADGLHTEKLIRLSGGFLCYRASNYSPDIIDPPFRKNGHIRFGCFNNMTKITETCVHLWSEILQQVEGSTLTLKSQGFSDPDICNALLAQFAEKGIDSKRIELLDFTPSVYDHLLLYHDIDIALDTFPYNGTTTTCEALWMGVPVVSLSGKTHASRVGLSILQHNALQDLVAHSQQAYVNIACQLASNPELLVHLRHNLRNHLANSPLCNAEAFIKGYESKLLETIIAYNEKSAY